MSDQISTMAEGCLDYFFDADERGVVPLKPEKRPARKKQKCQVHDYFVEAERQGYVTKHSFRDLWVEECLPTWIQAMSKCGKCSSCKSLWNYPNRTRMTQLYTHIELNAVLLKGFETDDKGTSDEVLFESEANALT